jgi:hypothetical protein
MLNHLKYLGVIIDNHLRFEDHVTYVIRKIVTKINYLGRMSTIVSTNTKKLIITVLLHPTLTTVPVFFGTQAMIM